MRQKKITDRHIDIQRLFGVNDLYQYNWSVLGKSVQCSVNFLYLTLVVVFGVSSCFTLKACYFLFHSLIAMFFSMNVLFMFSCL